MATKITTNQLQAILFDLDGTLLDRRRSLVNFLTWQWRTMLATEIADKNDFIRRFIELDANGSVWKDKAYAALIDEYSITGFSMEALLETYLHRFSEFCQATIGAKEAVRSLAAAGKKLGVITNGKSPFQENNLRALGIYNTFGTVVVSETVGLQKPDREIFHLACEKLQVKPEQAAFVGDNPVADIEGANNAGLTSVYVPGNDGASCDSADIICEELKELPLLLDLMFRPPIGPEGL